MTAPVFVDTNVLLYAIDDADPTKRDAARLWRAELWKSRYGRISFQVLQEYYANVAYKWPNYREQARAEIRDLLAWKPVPVGAAILLDAWRIQDRYGFSFWDSLIVAAAVASQCRYLLTEDLQSGQELEGLLIVNPFLTAFEAIQ